MWGSEGVALSVNARDVAAFARQLCLLFKSGVGSDEPCRLPVIGADKEGIGGTGTGIVVPPTSVLAAMERRLAGPGPGPVAASSEGTGGLRDELFTVEGLMRQLVAFFIDPTTSALTCQGKHRVTWA